MSLPRERLVPLIVACGLFMENLDSTVLATALPGVPVLVCEDRYVAGVLAHRRFAATVAILDDGFQHLQLARDVDLLLMSLADLDEAV